LVTARSLTETITNSEPLTRRVIARLGLEEAEKLASNLKGLAATTSALMEEPWARALAERQLREPAAMSRVWPTALAFLSEARQLVDERAAFVAGQLACQRNCRQDRSATTSFVGLLKAKTRAQ
jgi:hypothetical protein